MPLSKVSDNLFLDDPAPPGDASAKGLKATDPTAIVIFAWMNASLPHVKKYTDQYRAMFPYTPLILLMTTSSTFMRLHSTNLKALKPAKELIASRTVTQIPSVLTPPSSSASTLVPPPSPVPRVLVHSFSNGGAMSLRILDEIFRKSSSTGEEGFPAKALIIDSAPGTKSELGVTVRAFTAPFEKKPVTRFFVSILIGVFFGFAKMVGTVLGRPSPITLMSNYLVRYFHQPRLFFYSPADALVPSAEIEAHAQQLKEEGRDVTMVKFEGTGHVSHVRGEGNAERYWSAVKSFWERVGGAEVGK